jgi:hypothetical protein
MDQHSETSAKPRRLLSRKAGFKKLMVGATKGHALINSGRVKAVKLDGKTLLDEDSIDELLASLPDALTASRAA